MTSQTGGNPVRVPKHMGPGHSTATDAMIDYRLGKLQNQGMLQGTWLDCGCAEGGYTLGMLERGAERVFGVDPMFERVILARATASADGRANYGCAVSESLPFADASFDGVFLNEVLEHVADEVVTLRELRRVLRPGGYLALMSPNRWFPFEGHGMIIGKIKVPLAVPLLPWIPSRIAMPFMTARNYWPGELVKLVNAAGFDVLSHSSVLPVFNVYFRPPAAFVRWYRRAIPTLERTPVIRNFGVSTLVLARRPGEVANGRVRVGAKSTSH